MVSWKYQDIRSCKWQPSIPLRRQWQAESSEELGDSVESNHLPTSIALRTTLLTGLARLVPWVLTVQHKDQLQATAQPMARPEMGKIATSRDNLSLRSRKRQHRRCYHESGQTLLLKPLSEVSQWSKVKTSRLLQAHLQHDPLLSVSPYLAVVQASSLAGQAYLPRMRPTISRNVRRLLPRQQLLRLTSRVDGEH